MPVRVCEENPPEDVRVLLIDLSSRFGGASVRALTIAENMPRGNAAIAGLQDSPVMKIARERNIPTRAVGKSRADPIIPFRLRRIIRSERFQVIDTQNIQSKFWGWMAALMTQAAFVSTLNSYYTDEHGGSIKGKLYTWLDRLTNHRADRFIIVSETIRKGLRAAGISNAMIDLVGNAVKIAENPPVDRSNHIRQELGIPENAFMCASVGRLVWAKGYDHFITAFSEAVNDIPDSYAVILGDGALRPALESQIKAAGLEKRFLLLGYCEQSKVNEVLRESDVFILSSRTEGVPYALLEAASQGLPVISTRCGGIPDILTDNVDALLVPTEDPRALASAIMRLHQDRQLAKKLGVAVRDKISRDHSTSSLIRAMNDSYRKALEHRGIAK